MFELSLTIRGSNPSASGQHYLHLFVRYILDAERSRYARAATSESPSEASRLPHSIRARSFQIWRYAIPSFSLFGELY